MLFHFKSFLYMHYSQTYEASNSLIMVAGIFFFLSTSSPWYALSQILNDWGNSFDDFVFVLLQSFLEVFALF